MFQNFFLKKRVNLCLPWPLVRYIIHIIIFVLQRQGQIFCNCHMVCIIFFALDDYGISLSQHKDSIGRLTFFGSFYWKEWCFVSWDVKCQFWTIFILLRENCGYDWSLVSLIFGIVLGKLDLHFRWCQLEFFSTAQPHCCLIDSWRNVLIYFATVDVHNLTSDIGGSNLR